MAIRSNANIQPVPFPGVRQDPIRTTMLELVQTIGEITDDEREVVATVLHLLRSGQVRLIGNFRGQNIAAA